MTSRSLPWILVFALLLAPNAQAVEFILPGVYGFSTDLDIFIPSIGTNGLPNGDVTNRSGNVSVAYVNCRARIAVARVCGRADNFSGRSQVLVNNAQVATCVAIDTVDLINAVCQTNLSVNDVANASGQVIAVYGHPRRNIAFACVSAVGRL